MGIRELLWIGIACTTLSACTGGGVTSGASTSTTGEGGAGGEAATTSDTPSPPTTTAAGGAALFAVRKLRIGDITQDGQPSKDAWREYGFDIDGVASNKGSTGLCEPFAGADASLHEDAPGGVDNSFGKNILPLLFGLTSDFSTQNDWGIEHGRFTLLIRIEGLGAAQLGPFSAQAYTGRMTDVAPAWAGGDVWAANGESLVDGDLAFPKAQFPASEVLVTASGERLWESHGAAEVTLLLLGGGFELALPMRAVRMKAIVSADNGELRGGMLGGVLDTQAFLDSLLFVAQSFDPSFCDPSTTFDEAALEIRQAQDILLDGSQSGDAPCDGISVGLGFDAQTALLEGVTPEDWPSSPCFR